MVASARVRRPRLIPVIRKGHPAVGAAADYRDCLRKLGVWATNLFKEAWPGGQP